MFLAVEVTYNLGGNYGYNLVVKACDDTHDAEPFQQVVFKEEIVWALYDGTMLL